MRLFLRSFCRLETQVGLRSCLAKMSRKRKAGERDKKNLQDEDSTVVCSFHSFTCPQITSLQQCLLSWYDAQQRELPWRKIKSNDKNTRGYAVWVSEIMLQQTQVATVIDYYNRWMKTWPSLESLAMASVEEVNTLWSGLGYYSRGRRLLEGAQKVVKEMDGEMPRSAEELQRLLPGVGRYTAGAIASIAFGQVTGLVDGNVMRVLSRLQLIGAFITLPHVIDKFWSLANEIVDPQRPGDFNQAVMELGATVCTPKNPSCSQCPVKSLCHSHAKIEQDKVKSAKTAAKKFTKIKEKQEIPDIENAIPDCSLCLPSGHKWDASLGVTNLPRKPAKAKARQEDLYVLVLRKGENSGSREQSQYWMEQRPDKGLLAGLWEFPMRTLTQEDLPLELVLKEEFHLDPKHCGPVRDCGQVTHMFSHIHHNYHVLLTDAPEDSVNHSGLNDVEGRNGKWVSGGQMKDAAISTGMRKVFKLCQNDVCPKSSRKQRQGKTGQEQTDQKSQPSISSFFKPTKSKTEK